MVVAGFVAPYLLDTTTRFVQAAAALPDVELALITCEPEDRLPPGLKDNLAGHWRIDDGLDVSGATTPEASSSGPAARAGSPATRAWRRCWPNTASTSSRSSCS
ncbi:MAG: hypothetical protein ACLQB1_06075, partial [Streptosporangiaceae bacterium]